MWHWLLDAYQHHIVRSGRELLFMGVHWRGGFVLVHPIQHPHDPRAGEVVARERDPGGMHLHHVVFGLVFLLIGGIGNFALRGEGRPFRELLALLFGIGVGLVLDEFALILHLEDVYWSEEGRRSLDAVLLSVLLIGLLLVGEVPLGGRSPDDTHWTLAAHLDDHVVPGRHHAAQGQDVDCPVGHHDPAIRICWGHSPRPAAERLVALAL